MVFIIWDSREMLTSRLYGFYGKVIFFVVSRVWAVAITQKMIASSYLL